MPVVNGEYQTPCQTCEPCWSCISNEDLILPRYGDSTYTHYEPKEDPKPC